MKPDSIKLATISRLIHRAGPGRSGGDGQAPSCSRAGCRIRDDPDRSAGQPPGRFMRGPATDRDRSARAAPETRRPTRARARPRARAAPGRPPGPPRIRAPAIKNAQEAARPPAFAAGTRRSPGRRRRPTAAPARSAGIACSGAGSCKGQEKIAEHGQRPDAPRSALEQQRRQEQQKDRAELMREAVESIGLRARAARAKRAG